jgi:hypothetical protein
MSSAPKFNATESERLLKEIGESVAQSSKYEEYNWTGISIVFELDGDSPSQFGFVYLAGDAWEARTPGLSTLRMVPAFRDATKVPGEETWKKCLMQINRQTGGIAVDFDYDGTRWTVDPGNPERLALALKPR